MDWDIDCFVGLDDTTQQLAATFEVVDVYTTAHFVVQFSNNTNIPEVLQLGQTPPNLVLLSDAGIHVHELSLAPSQAANLILAWSPCKPGNLEAEIGVYFFHRCKRVTIFCTGDAMPGIGHAASMLTPPPASSGYLGPPAILKSSASLSLSGSSYSGSSSSNRSRRLSRVEPNKRRSLSRSYRNHHELGFGQRACSRSCSRGAGAPSGTGASNPSSVDNKRTGLLALQGRRLSLKHGETGSVFDCTNHKMSHRRASHAFESPGLLPQSARSSHAREQGTAAFLDSPKPSRALFRKSCPHSSSPSDQQPSFHTCRYVDAFQKPLSSGRQGRTSCRPLPSSKTVSMFHVESPTESFQTPLGVGMGSLHKQSSWGSSLRSSACQQPGDGLRSAGPVEALLIYDTEAWQRKQDTAFTSWLNMVLASKYKDQCKPKITFKHNGQQTTLRCRAQLGQIRDQDDSVVHALSQVEQHIKSGRLTFREDSLLEDAALRKKALRALLSYHPFWLQLAMETVLNRLIFDDMEDNRIDAFVTMADLEAAVREELLSDAQLQGGSYLSQRGQKQEVLKQVVIMRILMLVILLDRIPKHMNLPLEAPFIFRANAECKSSEQVLVDCLHSSLSGIGKLSRHLARMQYTVGLVQRDVDEWPVVVNSIASDLANGIILCKLASVLFGEDVMAEARKPIPGQRIVKMRNVRAALSALQRNGIDLKNLSSNRGESCKVVDVKAEDVVSGHCREVLALLWAIATKSFMQTLPISALSTEVRLLQRKLACKWLTAPSSGPAMLPGNDLPVTKLLFQWAQSVSGMYGVTLRTCRYSFLDGVALCLLIHHYVPSLVSWSAIYLPTPTPRDIAEQILCDSALGALESLSWADYVGLRSSVVQDDIDEHRQGIINNFQLISRAGLALGIAVDMIGPDDIVARCCDERAVLLCLASLCPKLLAFAHEGKAAQLLAEWWRWNRLRLMSLCPGVMAARARAGLKAERVSALWTRLADRVRLIPFRARLLQAALGKVQRMPMHVRWQALAKKACLVVQLQRRTRQLQAQRTGHARQQGHKVVMQHLAIVKLQAYVRGYLFRQSLVRRHEAATCIAAAWRGARARALFKQQQLAAQCIQGRWRQYRCLAKHFSARKIQSQVRMHLARQCFKQHRVAAILIQSGWRAHQARAHLRLKHSAASVIQLSWKRAAARQSLLKLSYCAKKIQSYWRGFCCRTRLSSMHAATERIQTAWRRHMLRQRIHQQELAAILIQKRWKMSRARHAGALRMQASWRGYVLRSKFRRMQTAAIVMQTCWRNLKERRSLQVLNSAAVVIQSSWRGHVQRSAFVYTRLAAVTIQTLWRGHKAKHSLTCAIGAATFIQSCWRAWSARQHLLRAHKALVLIQAFFRGWRTRQLLACKLNAVTCMQRHVRSWAARRHFIHCVRSAVIIQRHVKGSLARRRYQHEQLAVLRIQRFWRVQTCRQNAALQVQAAFRGMQCRRNFKVAVQCVVVIQAATRGWLARVRYNQSMLSAVRIQACIRGYLARLKAANRLSAIILFQAHWRAWQTRRWYVRLGIATRILQRGWRRYTCRKLSFGKVSNVILCQSCARRYLVRVHLAQKQEASRILQAAWRGYHCRARYLGMCAAGLLIQAHFRGMVVRQSLRTQQAASLSIQRMFRGWYVRHRLRLQSQSAVIVQKWWRMYRAHEHLRQVLAAVSKVQAASRGHAVRSALKRQHAAAATIQQAWRLHRGLASAAQTIQHAWRLFCIQKRKVAAVVALQAHWRRRQIQQQMARQTHAAILLQAATRGLLTRLHIARKRGAVARIIPAWQHFILRRTKARQRTAVWDLEHAVAARQDQKREVSCRQQRAATTLTDAAGVHLARHLVGHVDADQQALFTREAAACKIQAVRSLPFLQLMDPEERIVLFMWLPMQAWRRLQAVSSYRRYKSALMVLVRWVPRMKSWCAAREQQKRHRLESRAALVIQAHARGLAARQLLCRQHSAVTQIAARVRAWQVRRNSDPKTQEVAQRVLACAQKTTAQHKRLGPRTRAALNVLLSSKSIEQAASACAAMAWGTTYSRNACKWVVDEGGLIALFAFMRTCSRSVPHQEMLFSALTVTDNVLRLSDGGTIRCPRAVLARGVPILTESLQYFRDIEQLFQLLVLVLKRICKLPDVIGLVDDMPRISKQLVGVYKLLYNTLQLQGRNLVNLEVKKGSDASADHATRRLFAASNQLKSLIELLGVIHSVTFHETSGLHRGSVFDSGSGDLPSPGAWVTELAEDGRTWKPRNTVVRTIFAELQQSINGLLLPDPSAVKTCKQGLQTRLLPSISVAMKHTASEYSQVQRQATCSSTSQAVQLGKKRGVAATSSQPVITSQVHPQKLAPHFGSLASADTARAVAQPRTFSQTAIPAGPDASVRSVQGTEVFTFGENGSAALPQQKHIFPKRTGRCISGSRARASGIPARSFGTVGKGALAPDSTGNSKQRRVVLSTVTNCAPAMQSPPLPRSLQAFPLEAKPCLQAAAEQLVENVPPT